MALGIFAFGIMGLLGLLPVALQTHQDAKVSTVLAQIQQRLAAELLLTDGAKLSELTTTQRNFDVEGRELGSSEAGKTVYSAKLMLTNAVLPGGAASSSLQRATLYAVTNPAGTANFVATTPTAAIVVSKAENAQ